MWHVRVRTFATETQQTRFLFTAELHVTVNSIKISNIAQQQQQQQQHFCGEFMSPATIHRPQDIAKVPDLFSTDFQKGPQYQIARISVQWRPR
jgi:hypothetical protein